MIYGYSAAAVEWIYVYGKDGVHIATGGTGINRILLEAGELSLNLTDLASETVPTTVDRLLFQDQSDSWYVKSAGLTQTLERMLEDSGTATPDFNVDYVAIMDGGSSGVPRLAALSNFVRGADNIGGASAIYSSRASDGDLQFRTLANISVVGGKNVLKGVNGNVVEFRPLVAGSGVTITEFSTYIGITSP